MQAITYTVNIFLTSAFSSIPANMNFTPSTKPTITAIPTPICKNILYIYPMFSCSSVSSIWFFAPLSIKFSESDIILSNPSCVVSKSFPSPFDGAL